MRLNGTDDPIDRHQYPATTEELIDEYGDHLIELQNGTETLGEVLGRAGSETFRTPQDVRESLYANVSHKAIGRRFYSDRDAPTASEHGPEQVSF